MRLPIRSVVCRTGGKEGKQKGAAPGYRMRKKQFPQEAKSEIPNPVEKDKAKQKQNRKSKRDDNRHERSRTLTPGGTSKLGTRYGARRTLESNHPRYSRRGRQTVSNTSLNTATSGGSWYYCAIGSAGGGWPNQGCSEASSTDFFLVLL